jgi:2-oxoglutarate dehydrogenase E2 component (dihydrolipoamide succinyltransferase)
MRAGEKPAGAAAPAAAPVKESPATPAKQSPAAPAPVASPAAPAPKAAAPAPSPAPAAAPKAADIVRAGSRTETRVAMGRMRLRIAQRLKESQNTAAMLTTFQEVRMRAVVVH